MKKFLLSYLLFFSVIGFARDINEGDLKEFSAKFKSVLKENSYTGFFCYLNGNDRRIVGIDDANKSINLGASSNIITNYLAYKLENNGKFNRYEDIQNYAKIFKYKAKKITFADLLSSRASIASHLDKIYPSDAKDYEYFSFLWQMNPSLFSQAEYDYSKLSNLGAVYALSYSQNKSENALMAGFEKLVEAELKEELPSLKLNANGSDLDYSFSLNVKDLAQYLYLESQGFAGKSIFEIERSKVYNGWLFTEIDLCRLAMSGGQSVGTFLVAIFYDRNIAVALFIDEFRDENARKISSQILSDFVKVLNR